eukprot:m.306553 g.306553  ORF g.306553 m.306553 type:complete len:402 (+) comp55309_c1_seq2:174-1379(+)
MQPHMYTSLYAGDVMANLSGEDPLFVAFTVQESCRVYIFNYASGHLESISLPSVTHISAARAAVAAAFTFGIAVIHVSSTADHSVVIIKTSPPDCVRLFHTRALVASGHGKGELRIHATDTGALLHNWFAHRQLIRDIFIPWHDSVIISAGDHIKLSVRDITLSPLGDAPVSKESVTLTDMKSLAGHKSFIKAVVMLSDEDTIISGSVDKSIRVWSRKTMSCAQILMRHKHWVEALALHPNQPVFASASADRMVIIWDSVHFDVRQTISCSGEVRSIAFDSHVCNLFAGVYLKGAMMYDTTTGREVTCFSMSARRGELITGVALVETRSTRHVGSENVKRAYCPMGEFWVLIHFSIDISPQGCGFEKRPRWPQIQLLFWRWTSRPIFSQQQTPLHLQTSQR